MNSAANRVVLAACLVVGCSERVAAEQPPQDAAQSDVSTLFWRARESQKAGQHETAIRLFSEVLQRDPQHTKVYMCRAESCRAIKQYDQVIADCTAALRLDRTKPGLYILRATAHEEKGDFQSARQDLDDLILLGTGQPYRPRLRRGLVLVNLQQWEKAIADLEPEVNTAPQYLPTLASLHLQTKNFDKSVKCYTSAIHIHLEAVAKEKKLGGALQYSTAHDYDEHTRYQDRPHDSLLSFERSEFEERVLTLLEKFAAEPYQDTKLAALYLGRGACLLEAQNSQSAAVDFADAARFALPDSSEHQMAKVMLAKLTGGQGVNSREPGAPQTDTITAMTEAIHAGNPSWEALKIRGDAYLQARQFDKAIEDYTAAVRLNGKEPAIFKSYAIALYSEGQFNQAITACNRALALAPRDASLYRLRADAHRQQEEYDEAAGDYFEMLRWETDDFSICREGDQDVARTSGPSLEDIERFCRRDSADDPMSRGIRHLKKREYDSALEHFEAAREEAQADRTGGMPDREYGALLALAMVYAETGDNEQAISILRSVNRRLEPGNPVAGYIAQLLEKSGDDTAAIQQYQTAIRALQRKPILTPSAYEMKTECLRDNQVRLAELYLRSEPPRVAEAKQLLARDTHRVDLFAQIYAGEENWPAAVSCQSRAFCQATKTEARQVARRLAQYLAHSPGPSKEWPRKRLLPEGASESEKTETSSEWGP